MKTSSYLAIATAAGLMLGGVTMAPKAARAADLGGDCCADLESRVAELEATTVRKGNKKVSLTITGRVAATMTFWSDSTSGLDPNYTQDVNSDLYFGDHSGNGPQFILKGEGKISSDLVAGYYMELNPNSIGGGTHADAGILGSKISAPASGDTQVSHMAPGGNVGTSDTYVYLSSKRLGTLQLGHTDSAGDQYFANFNGAWIAGEQAGRFNSILLRDANGLLTTTSYGSALSTLEPGGENGVRYISPDMGGFSFNVSENGDAAFGAGANYSVTHGTVSFKAGVGYAKNTEVDGLLNPINASFLGLSAGLKESSSGLFIEGQWAKKTINTVGSNDPTEWLIEAGWAKNISGAGDFTLWGAYNTTNDLAFSGTSAHDWQIGIDQSIDSAATHLFLTYENDSFDGGVAKNVATLLSTNTATAAAINSQNVSSVTAGMSISF